MNLSNTTHHVVAQRIVYFLKTTTHSRAAPSGIFASCADISDLPTISDVDWIRSVDKAEQQTIVYTYISDNNERSTRLNDVRHGHT